jgi:hypothetical protein
MNTLLSIAVFLASAFVSVSGVPLETQVPLNYKTYMIPSAELWVFTNPAPRTIIRPGPGNLIGQVSWTNGKDEVDTIVSFPLGGRSPPTPNSKCQFQIRGVTPSPTGPGIIRLSSLGGQVVSPLQPSTVPSYIQYWGRYNVKTNPSTPIDMPYIPCQFNSNGFLQIAIRPQQDTDFALKWTQSHTVGAFLVYTP